MSYAVKNLLNINSDAKKFYKNFFMNPNDIDINKLPADIRRTFKQLHVLHAEKKIRNKAKDDFISFVKCVWPDFLEGSNPRHIAKKFN